MNKNAIWILIVMLMATGCQAGPASAQPWAAPTSTADAGPEYSGGISTRFDGIASQQRYPKETADGSHTYVYDVKPGEAFEGDLGIVSSFPDAKSASLTLLLNYSQADFQPGNGEFVHTTEVTLQPNEEQDIHIRTRPLPEGYFDFALVIVIDPQDTTMDTRHRARTTFTPVIRASIYAGDATPPDIDYERLSDISVDPEEKHSDALFLTDEPGSFVQWPGRIVKPGEIVRLFLRFSVPYYAVLPGEPPDSLVPFAFVGFMDGQVTPVTGRTVGYGRAGRGGVVNVPVDITAPQSPGLHQFFIHRFPNPYTNVMTTIPMGGGYYSLSTQRVVFDVEPQTLLERRVKVSTRR